MKAIFRKDSQSDKKNYRPNSIHPNVTKIYERCLNKQLDEYFQVLLSKYQCDFRKGCTIINVLLPMIKKWINFVSKGTDPSKAFNCLPHELLIVTC